MSKRLTDKERSILETFYISSQEYFDSIEEKNDKGYFGEYIDLMCPKESISVSLDVGCGAGRVSLEVAQRGSSSYGVDISPIGIKKATKKAKELGVENYVEFKVSSPTCIPYPDNFFDIVGAFAVFEHLVEPELVTKEMLRVLKPNGKIIIYCPNFLSPFIVVGKDEVSHSNFFIMRLVRNMVKNFFYLNFVRIFLKTCGINNTLHFTPENISNLMGGEKICGDMDAVFASNPKDIRTILKRNGGWVKVCSSLSFRWQNNLVVKVVNRIPFLRDLGPSVLVIGEKKG